MCGRLFRHEVSLKEYLDSFDSSPFDDFSATQAAYNVAPKQSVPIVRRRGAGDRLELVHAQWGLVPAWWRKPMREMKFSTFNARSETAPRSKVFRAAYRQRRCLVPVSGFYEWSGPKGARTAHAIGCRNRRWFCLGGLWERAMVDDAPLESFTILTTEANELMAPIHNRMPVVLHPDDYARWLHGPATAVAELCRPYAATEMQAWKVGTAVGNVRNQGKELLAEI